MSRWAQGRGNHSWSLWYAYLALWPGSLRCICRYEGGHSLFGRCERCSRNMLLGLCGLVTIFDPSEMTLYREKLPTLTPCKSFQRLKAVAGGWWETCSETKCVVPASSWYFPRNISPKNGFNGFSLFFFPFSSFVLCCCLRVLRNHFNTSNARFSGSGSLAGATKSDGCSAQYAENSVTLWGDRRKGGAVKEDKSPLNVAID